MAGDNIIGKGAEPSGRDDGGKEIGKQSAEQRLRTDAFSSKIDAQGKPAVQPDKAFETAKAQGDHAGTVSALSKLAGIDLSDPKKAGAELKAHMGDTEVKNFVGVMGAIKKGIVPTDAIQALTSIATAVGGIRDLQAKMPAAQKSADAEDIKRRSRSH